MKKKIYYIISFLLSLTVLICSLVVIFGYKIEGYLISSNKPEVSKVAMLNNQLKAKNANYDWSNLSDTNLVDQLKTKTSTSLDNVVGLITQPDAKVAATIVAGVSPEDLNFSAGTLREDNQMGSDNYVLAAHHVPKSDWALFSGMFYYGDIGQYIYITDLNKVYQYKITETRFVSPSDTYIAQKDRYKENVDGIVPGKPMITTITCDSTGAKRFIEFGTLTNTWDIKDKKIPSEAITGFKKAANFNWSR